MSFDAIQLYHERLVEMRSPVPPFVLVATKVDDEPGRIVTRTDGEELAANWGCGYVEVSAKTGEGVEEVVLELVRKLRVKSASKEVEEMVKVEKTNSSCVIM